MAAPKEDWQHERARVLAQARVVVVKVGSAVLTDANGLSLPVLENLAAQLAQLRNLGCEFGQGYLLARPLSPEMAATTALVDLRRAEAGTPPLPRPATDGPGLTPWATTSPAPLAVH